MKKKSHLDWGDISTRGTYTCLCFFLRSVLRMWDHRNKGVSILLLLFTVTIVILRFSFSFFFKHLFICDYQFGKPSNFLDYIFPNGFSDLVQGPQWCPGGFYQQQTWDIDSSESYRLRKYALKKALNVSKKNQTNKMENSKTKLEWKFSTKDRTLTLILLDNLESRLYPIVSSWVKGVGFYNPTLISDWL